MQLNPKLFPTHWTPYSLRNFHRPIFCRPNYGKHHKAPFVIRSVTKRIRKKAKVRINDIYLNGNIYHYKCHAEFII